MNDLLNTDNLPIDHANASAAVPTHFSFNLPDHSLTDISLIPLELQPSKNTARRKIREAYFIEKGRNLSFPLTGQTVVTKTNETFIYTLVLYFIYFICQFLFFYRAFTFLIYLSCILLIPYTVTFCHTHQLIINYFCLLRFFFKFYNRYIFFSIVLALKKA